jgi:hypothetical protein
VYNFEDKLKPKVLKMAAGTGKKLKRRYGRLRKKTCRRILDKRLMMKTIKKNNGTLFRSCNKREEKHLKN